MMIRAIGRDESIISYLLEILMVSDEE